MRLVAFALAFILVSGMASAFPCNDVSLPSNIVICSDPELIRLGDERQATIDQLRARIGEPEWPVFWETQKAWVRSYPQTCGVDQDGPPPSLPVSDEIRNCFRQAALARLAVIRAYGFPASEAPPPSTSPAADRVGPSFPCANAQRPLEVLICSDLELSKTDLRYAQPYYVLRYSYIVENRIDYQKLLRNVTDQFVASVLERCDLPDEGPAPHLTPDRRKCIKGQYEAQRARWVGLISSPSPRHEEAVRPIDLHIDLQRDLAALQFLPAGEDIDGVYGGETRKAIVAWQTVRGRVATGFLSDVDARALEQEVVPIQPPSQASLTPSERERVARPPPAPAVGGEVTLKEDGGAYYVPVRINDRITLDFLIDTGATDVLIPADVVMTLFRTKTLMPTDFMGERDYALADGSKLPSAQFTLRELQVGNHVVLNVTASVGKFASGPLLGQSFLTKFKSVTLDNERHVLVLTEK